MSSERQSTLLDQLQPSNSNNDATVDPMSEEQVNDVLQTIVNDTTLPPMPANIQYQPIEYSQDQEIEKIDEEEEKQNNFVLSFLMSHDVKLAVLCSLVFLCVCFIPIENIVFKYISLDKIPYANMYIKAILAGIIFFTFAKVLESI